MSNVAQFVLSIEYGNERWYPKNSVAKAFATLARADSLVRDQLEVVRQLGFEIEIASMTLEEWEAFKAERQRQKDTPRKTSSKRKAAKRR